jgi:hypothetical protein
MAGSFAHAPTLFEWNGNFVNIFAVDPNGGVHHKNWNGSTWSPSVTGWIFLGGLLASRVVVAARGKDEFTLFGIGMDGHLKAKWWDGTDWGPSPTDWQDLGGDLVGEPAVASYRGETLSVLAVDTNGRAQHLLWDGSTWSAWQDMGGALRASPALLPWISTAGTTGIPVPIGPVTGTLLGMGLLLAGQRALRRKPAD